MEPYATITKAYTYDNELERAIHRGFLCAGVDNVPINIIKETAQDCLLNIKNNSDMENRLNELAKRIHQDNVERGFYDEKRELGTLLMLIVSEVSEALEADRKGRHVNIHEIAEYANPDKFKEYIKDTFEDEIADTFIRLFDLVGYLGIDIEAHIGAKLAFNKTRGHKHGKKY